MKITKKQLELIISKAELLGRANANVGNSFFKGDEKSWEFFKKESEKLDIELKNIVNSLK